MDALGGDVDGIAGARIAALAGIAITARKGTEAAKLHPAAALQLIDDGVEEGGDHALDLLDRQIRVIFAQFLHKLGTDQGKSPTR